MIPFFVFRKKYTVNKTPYQLFNKINNETSNGSLADVDVRFEDNDPPVFRFVKKGNELGLRAQRINAILWAKIEEEGNDKSNVDIAIYSNASIYIAAAICLLAFLVSIINANAKTSSMIVIIIFLSAIALLDLHARKQIFKRFDNFIPSY